MQSSYSFNKENYSFINSCEKRLETLNFNFEKLEMKQKQRKLVASTGKISTRPQIRTISGSQEQGNGLSTIGNNTNILADEQSDAQAGVSVSCSPERRLKRNSKGKRNLLALIQNDE